MVTDPAQAAVIHRAVGVLIDQGLPPDDAVLELRRRATVTGRTLSGAAHHLLQTATPGEDPDPTP